MLKIVAVIGATTYHFASEDIENFDENFWEGRISNTFEIERSFDVAEDTGNRVRTIQVSLDNRDNFFRSVEVDNSFLNSKFTLYFGDGADKVKTFTGMVNKVDSFGEDVVLTIMEKGYEYLKQNFPDAQIADNYYSENGINSSWVAIPIPFGTVNKMPLPWVNLFRSEFMIGSGPLFKISKLYFDKVVVYDLATGKNGYKPTPESQEIKFRIFKGTGSGDPTNETNPTGEIVDGVHSKYPGFAYIQLYKIVDNVEEPSDPITPDGEASQIYADVEGIVNDAGTAAERNPMKILHMLFTKPTTGYQGYGLGIDESEIDSADAIVEAAAQGFKIDGSIDQIAEFGQWCDELLRSSRAVLTEENGKIKFYVDKAKSYSGAHFDETGEIGLDCNVSTWNEPELEAQINRLKLSYSWNYEKNDFNKKPGVHEESPILDPNLKNEAHALRVLKWNTDTIEFKLVKDDTTAHKLAQYYLNRTVKQLKITSLTTSVDIPNIDGGSLIKITSPKHGWIQKEFTVTKVSRAEELTAIDVKEYSSDVYTFIDPGTASEPADNGYSAYNIPEKPILNNLSVENEILTDGSNQTTLAISFTKPASNVQMVAIYYKLATDPENAFKVLDFTVNETELRTIWKGKATGDYNFRLVSISSAGVYSNLDIESGDKHYLGQPDTEESQPMTGDSIAPGTPEVIEINPVIGGASFYIEIAGGMPDDFSHFEIYRKIGSDNPVLLDENYPSQLFTDLEKSIGYVERSYSVVAVDNSLNRSVMSSQSANVTPLKVATGDIYAGSITTELLTAQQIIAKDFRTATNAGNGTVSGVLFNENGIQAWNGANKTFSLDAATGNGSIGGWSISSEAISKVTTAGGVESLNSLRDSIYSHRADSNYGEWHGQIYNGYSWTGRYGFAVTRGAGNYIFRADTDINGDNACNQIAGWNFDTSHIYSNNIGIYSTGTIQTLDFVTGNKGWKIDYLGNAEFNNITARGAIRTAVFIKDEISVVGGYALIRPAETLKLDSLLSINNTWLYVADTAQFAINDIVRIKDGSNDFWGCVYGKDSVHIYVARQSGTYAWTPAKGQAIVNYGAANSGGIMLNGQAPYIDIYTHDGSPWNGTKSRVRIGNLSGWGAFGITYGIAVGCPTGNYLTYDTTSSVLNIKGAIVITGGSGIASLSDAGCLATVSNLDGVPNGTTYRKTTVNQVTGAGRAYSSLNASNALITKVIPGSVAAPSAAGLYLGSDYLGYYNAGWKTYMDNSGKFYLAGATGGLSWNGTLLTICGTICSDCGVVGGWGIACDSIAKANLSSGVISLNSLNGSVYAHRCSPELGEFHGQIYNNGGWTGRYGLAVTRGAGVYMFRSDTDIDGNNACNQIAGWNFNSSYMSKHIDILGTKMSWTWLSAVSSLPYAIYAPTFAPMGTGVAIHRCGYTAGFVMLGRLPALSGLNITGNTDLYGLYGTLGGVDYFKLAFNDGTGEVTADIAGWRFNGSCFYSTGYGLVLNSSGSICGNYAAGSTGWAIFADGSAEFNNVTVRGCVEAISGRIGCFNINSGNIYSRIAAANNCGHFDMYGSAGMPQLTMCHRCLIADTFTSSFDYKSWYDGSSYSWAPLQVSSCGPITAYFNNNICVGVGVITPSVTSSSFRHPAGLGGSEGYFIGGLNGSTTAFAPFGIYMCSGSACYAFYTNGVISVNSVVCTSDRNLKTDIQDIEVLPYLRQLEVSKWRFKDSNDYHIGPMAQDFNPIFKLSQNWATNLSIGGLDGIALKAAKEIDAVVQTHDLRILKLETENIHLENENATLKDWISKLSEKISNIEMSLNLC